MAVLIPAALATFFIGIAGIIFVPDEIKNKPLDFDKGTIKIGDSVINVEIAESDAERQRWLMFRNEEFPLNSAMILVYPKSDLYALWLLNIQFNLDIMWFNEEGKLVYLIRDAKPCENPLDPHSCTFKTNVPAKYIVVSTKGFIKENNITSSSILTKISI